MDSDWLAPAAGIVGTAVGGAISLAGTRISARDRFHERRSALAREIIEAAEETAASLVTTRKQDGTVPWDTMRDIAHLISLTGSLRGLGAPEGLRIRCVQIVEQMVREQDPTDTTILVGTLTKELSTWLRGWRPGAWQRWRKLRRDAKMSDA